ncbi:MAG: D-tyrosyl-tRNA(Tyr) deacylase [Gammaproteobacteria bacterium]|nr:D-tyrosyl-tRNA(Tyr) deacylase [Gammaproteobacteria bacterium]
MRAVIQRVNRASVVVNGECVGEIERGLLVLLGVEKNDGQSAADKLLNKVLDYRIFPDDDGKMNLSLKSIGGELLIVSQFTVAADTKKGLRPSFSSAAQPALACELYEYWVKEAKSRLPKVATGEFGSDMQVSLVNDGPVTFILEAS